MNPYEGDEPYIFISYVRDGPDIQPLLKELQRRGYRFWYDKGMRGGSDWLEELARKVKNCNNFFALLSEKYPRKNICKDELSFAHKYEKIVLLIYLEDVQITDGMDLQNHRYHYLKYDSDESFFQELERADNLSSCLDSGIEKHMAKESEETGEEEYDDEAPFLSGTSLTAASSAVTKILDFWDRNRLYYQNLINRAKAGSIIPFAGETLSESTFGSVEEFVRKVYALVNRPIDSDINSADFLKIFEMLFRKFGENGINDVLEAFYSDQKIDDRFLRNQAVSLIPYVNGETSITSNLDHVIDHSYQIARKEPSIVQPFESYQLTQRSVGRISRNNLVLKIHGDIGSDPKHRILTRESFSKIYDESSEFFQRILDWLRNYAFLFVGVHPEKDRYLFELVNKLNGEKHYAFIGCRNASQEKSRIAKELDRLGIQAILYDETKPESLEVLLHKFLIDIDHPPGYRQGEVDYRYSQQDLTGRKEQLEKLENFLKNDEKFLWTIINGTRSTGRTKLAYESAKIYAADWEWYILEPEEIDDFLSSQVKIQRARTRTRKLLVIFDDFYWYAGTLDKIFSAHLLQLPSNNKIRFVFVTNDVKNDFMPKLNGCSSKNLQKIRNFMDPQSLVEVKPLSEDEVTELCRSYIRYRSFQLGIIEEEIDTVLSEIEDELRTYIRELIKQNSSDILTLSQLKAINLVKKIRGDTYQNDSEIAEKFFKLSISMEQRSSNDEDFNYDLWMQDKIEKYQNAKQVKDYYTNKENPTDLELADLEKGTEFYDNHMSEDDEMSRSHD